MSVISHMLYKVQDSTCQDFGWASMLQGHEVNPRDFLHYRRYWHLFETVIVELRAEV